MSTLKAVTVSAARMEAIEHAARIHDETALELRARVDALEARFAALESRMSRVDRMLGEIQLSLKRVEREQAEKLQEQTGKLQNLESMTRQILNLLQPTVVVGVVEDSDIEPSAK